jgi:murein DD-endopeptidase MepM/ murein hydrolase activator NlpD
VTAFRGFLACLLVLLVAGGTAGAARKRKKAEPANPEQSLAEAQRALADKRRRADQIRPVIQRKARQEERTLAELERWDRALAARRAELKAYKEEIDMTQAQLDAMHRQTRLTSAELARSAARLREDLVAWQTGGAGDDGTEAVRRVSPSGETRGESMDIGEVAIWCGTGEADRLSEARMTKFDLQLRSLRQTEHLATLKRLRRELAAKERELAVTVRQRAAFLRTVRVEKAQNVALLNDYQVAAQKLERVVDRLAVETRLARQSALVPSSARVGQLLRPVAGPLLRRFGRQKHETFNATVFSTGIEIKAKEGTPVRAAASGRVVFLDWLQGFGRVMIVDHGSGFCTVYGHLRDATADVGTPVTRGATIGTVGDTGSLGAPSLYFEVRNHGQPADPGRYLGGDEE